jgi:hypothetical protein
VHLEGRKLILYLTVFGSPLAFMASCTVWRSCHAALNCTINLAPGQGVEGKHHV